MIISGTTVVTGVFNLFWATVASGGIALRLATFFEDGDPSSTRPKTCFAVFAVVEVVLVWAAFGHPGVEFVA